MDLTVQPGFASTVPPPLYRSCISARAQRAADSSCNYTLDFPQWPHFFFFFWPRFQSSFPRNPPTELVEPDVAKKRPTGRQETNSRPRESLCPSASVNMQKNTRRENVCVCTLVFGGATWWPKQSVTIAAPVSEVVCVCVCLCVCVCVL